MDEHNEQLNLKTVYDELASLGLLDGYLKSHMSEKMSNDQPFRDRMMRIFFQRSPMPVQSLELFLLERMVEHMGYFLEYTKPWQQKQEP